MNRNKISFALRFLALLLASIAAAPSILLACSRGKAFSFDELFVADVIVRATAFKDVAIPDLSAPTTSTTIHRVEFKVEETLKGQDVPGTLVLNGKLTDRDDYNDVEVPYKFVRPGGRGGNCVADTYKEGAQFLLFLKKTPDGYTSNISALGPTNEQLHGSDDAWLWWVKNYLKHQNKKRNKAAYVGEYLEMLTAWVVVDLAGAI